MPESPTDLLRAAIDRSGYSNRNSGFAREILDVSPRSVRYMLAGERPLIGPIRQICRAIVSGAIIPAVE